MESSTLSVPASHSSSTQRSTWPDFEAIETERDSTWETSADVAALSTERAMAMSREDMIAVIGSVRGEHLRPGVRERLPQMDSETLRRLVFLTRRFCRHQQELIGAMPFGIAAG